MSLFIENIVIIILSSSVAAFGLLYFRAILKLREINKVVIDLFFKNTVLSQSIDNTNLESVSDIHKENFIKFLSDSREWAFEYIDTVQKELKGFIDEVDKDIKYFDEYGEVGSAYPHYDSMKKISNAYKKIKTLLPEDTNDRR